MLHYLHHIAFVVLCQDVRGQDWWIGEDYVLGFDSCCECHGGDGDCVGCYAQGGATLREAVC